MNQFDRIVARFPLWTVVPDGRGLALYRELAMARSPLRRAAPQAAAGPTPRQGGRTDGASAGSRARPGRRW